MLPGTRIGDDLVVSTTGEDPHHLVDHPQLVMCTVDLAVAHGEFNRKFDSVSIALRLPNRRSVSTGIDADHISVIDLSPIREVGVTCRADRLSGRSEPSGGLRATPTARVAIQVDHVSHRILLPIRMNLFKQFCAARSPRGSTRDPTPTAVNGSRGRRTPT